MVTQFLISCQLPHNFVNRLLASRLLQIHVMIGLFRMVDLHGDLQRTTRRQPIGKDDGGIWINHIGLSPGSIPRGSHLGYRFSTRPEPIPLGLALFLLYRPVPPV